VELAGDTHLRFLGVEEARALLVRPDGFVRSMSPFDRSARMKTAEQVGVKRFLSFVSRQAEPWTSEDMKKLKGVIRRISRLKRLHDIDLPADVPLIKTSGLEEGGAAYQRAGAIVLPRNVVDGSEAGIEHTLLHELFHVMSSRDRGTREVLYRIIGFRDCGGLEFPASLARRKITNPDAYENRYCTVVEHHGREVTVFPVLFSGKDKYDPGQGGEFFGYLVFRLLAAKKADGRWVAVAAEDGQLLIDPEDAPSFLDKLGKNTGYMIHPEEVMADNFVLYVMEEKDVPSPHILEEMERVFMRRK
jgi:hypothetical protein